MTIAKANARLIAEKKAKDDEINKLLCSVIKMGRVVPLQKVSNFWHLITIYARTIELLDVEKSYRDTEAFHLAGFIRQKKVANLRQSLIMSIEDNDPTILRMSLYLIHDKKKNHYGISTNRPSKRKTG